MYGSASVSVGGFYLCEIRGGDGEGGCGRAGGAGWPPCGEKERIYIYTCFLKFNAKNVSLFGGGATFRGQGAVVRVLCHLALPRKLTTPQEEGRVLFSPLFYTL
jgi:hypothetical protein